MPDNIASSYANSIDPAGGIARPTTNRGTHPEPLSPSADFNAHLPVTAEQLKAQQTPTMPSEQVAKTNLGQNDGPKMTGPFGETIYAGRHFGAKDKDGARAIAHTNSLNTQGRVQQKAKGRAVVSEVTLKKLKNINARETLKFEFKQRVQEARAEERQAPVRQLNRKG